MTEFELSGNDFIPLDKLLKLSNLVQSGGEAHQCIDAGEVSVNGIKELRRRMKLRSGDLVLFRGEKIKIV